MRNQTTIAEKAADYARADLAADVPLAMERALKGGVPRRALLASISRVMSVTFVTVAAADVARNGAPTGTK